LQNINNATLVNEKFSLGLFNECRDTLFTDTKLRNYPLKIQIVQFLMH